ncbi:hypothetical protein GKAS_00571 [Kluyvera ascorbata ATCC 33433]|nr:hypothetical protein GKAS_00571 [Kluyvera ascorbata ATCC 33433]BCA41631.1 hypothetical protein KATP_41530 [Kluyvera ascorbata]STX00911.1 Secreted protein hcp [Kluyvera ascorbata]
MAIPGNMWLYDDGVALIKGGCDVQNREFSIEFKGFHHNLSIPTDNATGKPTGMRQHSSMLVIKEFDYSSPYLYKAVATGQVLQKAELKWYKINDAGQEVEYFNMLLEGVRIVSVSPTMAASSDTNNNHLSILSRKLLRDARFPFGLRPVAPMGKLSKLKMVPTNRIATFLGRWVPFVGHAQLIITVQVVAKRTRDKYNLIARPKDRIQWTSF